MLKQSVISQIRQQEANPGAVAQNKYNQLIYGTANIRSKNLLGTLESVNAITPVSYTHLNASLFACIGSNTKGKSWF